MRGVPVVPVLLCGHLAAVLGCGSAEATGALAPASPTLGVRGRAILLLSPSASFQRDSDGDGESDARDACPELPGLPSRTVVQNGCPPPGYYDDGLVRGDRDGDGVGDAMDACADDPGAPSDVTGRNGCSPDLPLSASDGPLEAATAAPPPLAEQCRQASTIEVAQAAGCPLAWVHDGSIRFVGTIAFQSGSAGLLHASEVVLEAVARLMKEQPELQRVHVVGHTDGVGSREANLRLSQRRAEQVVAQLTRSGIDPGRLSGEGLGAEQPVDSNAIAEGRARNRRVELRVEAPAVPEETSHGAVSP